ncbi:MAG: glycosyltransferase family protein [Acidimicrobiales bacterium]
MRSLLLYAHDTYGLGHLRRNLAIAGHLLSTSPGLQVVLMSGSPVAELFDIPRGLDIVRLPPVVKVGSEEYRPRDARYGMGLLRRIRSAVMTDVATRLKPDVFLVDHAPQGMRGELLPVFDALRTYSPATRLVLGLRDIVDDPAVVRQVWNDQGIYETLRTVFDRILVYGSPEILDVTAAYELDSDISEKITYCGYLARRCQGRPIAEETNDGYVLGTAGGGGDGAEILSATLSACASIGIRSHIVTGPLMAAEERQMLAQQAAADPLASVTDFVADMGAEMAHAGAVVSMGGYNSLTELVSLGIPTVVVPRLAPRVEQLIRARSFARRGVVSVVEPGPALDERLAAGLTEALAAGRRKHGSSLDLDGLTRVRAALATEARLARRARGLVHLERARSSADLEAIAGVGA